MLSKTKGIANQNVAQVKILSRIQLHEIFTRVQYFKKNFRLSNFYLYLQ